MTLEKGRGKYQKYLPFVFTEHGILMLSSILKSDKAIQTNIQIMRIFTKVRQMLLDTTEIKVDIMKAFLFPNLLANHETIGIINIAVKNEPKMENIAGTVPAIS